MDSFYFWEKRVSKFKTDRDNLSLIVSATETTNSPKTKSWSEKTKKLEIDG